MIQTIRECVFVYTGKIKDTQNMDLDSMYYLELLHDIEIKTGKSIPFELFLDTSTIKDIFELYNKV